MNIQSHRRLSLEEALRDRIKARIEGARLRQEQTDPEDNCPCPLCTMRRSLGFPRGTQEIARGVVEVGESESLMDALGRAAKTLIDGAEADDAAKAGKKTH